MARPKHGDSRRDELRRALDMGGDIPTLSLPEAAAVADYEVVRESKDAALVRVLDVAGGHGVSVESGDVWVAKKAKASGDRFDGVNLIEFARGVYGDPTDETDVIEGGLSAVSE